MATGNIDTTGGNGSPTYPLPTAGQIPNTEAGASTAFYGQKRPSYTAPTASYAAPNTPASGNTPFGTAFRPTAAGINSYQSGVYGSDNANFSTFSMGTPIQHNRGGWGATYYGPVARVDNTIIGDAANNGGFNQLLLNLPPMFPQLIQKEVLVRPRFWHDRIPRGAFQLFNGTTGETNIFRGALYKCAGLDEWEDINPVPSLTNNPCGSGQYDTIKYGWERLQWSGKKAYWGSDPICLDSLKFSPKVQEQLAMILSAGADYGIQMQEVWNRDMFIYQSVVFGRSFVMSTDFYGPTDSPRYFYDPFVKFGADGDANGKVADKSVVGSKPFILVDAASMNQIEPLNFDVLDQVRESLKIRCPTAAVSRGAGEPMFALAVSADDVERYIRGNEEERRYWIENDPAALIQHYGFAPSTFKRWIITNDGNQLRFKVKGVVKYDAAKFGGVGSDYFAAGQDVLLAVAVDPQIPSKTRVGIGGSPIPEDNPDYYRAELAIAPIFMNQVFTNLFVPTVSTLGSGTYFGPVTGLNGKWGWTNFRDSTNPEGNVGKFFGKFEIVPRPETHVFHCTSFLYRRCTQPLRSLCPSENVRVNPDLSLSADTNGSGVVKTRKVSILDEAEGLVLVNLEVPMVGLAVGKTATVTGGVSGEIVTVRSSTSFVIRIDESDSLDDSEDSSSEDGILSSQAGKAVTLS